MACQAKGREVRIIHYHVGQYRVWVQPHMVVDNLISLCKPTSGSFFHHWAVRAGHLILE